MQIFAVVWTNDESGDCGVECAKKTYDEAVTEAARLSEEDRADSNSNGPGWVPNTYFVETTELV